MPATITTANTGGIAPRTGYFSGTLGVPLDQTFFDAAFAGRVHADPIYRESFNCNLIGQCTMSTWIEEYTGYDTFCHTDYKLLEYSARNMHFIAGNTVTIGAYPATGIIDVDNASHYVNGAYVLPQVGNILVLTKEGKLAKVIAVTHATAFDTTVTVQLMPTQAGTAIITAGDTILVLPGSQILDCDCPTGQFRFDDLPIEHDLTFYDLGDKGELCGDALLACQYLKIPFTDECGNTIEKWYTKALQDMYKDHEMTKHFQRLLNPNFGIIPTIKARGLKFTPASPTAITITDVREWKGLLNVAGVECMEYAIFAGRNLYSQWMQMLIAEGINQLDNSLQPLQECKWLNMEWCGVKVEGMTLHIYEECTFSNGKLLGGANMVFPNSAIWIPMCNRTTNCRGAYDNKMITTVYFKDNTGRVWDNVTDSNGILNGANGRNTFGTGCMEHEWTIRSRFTQEVHCPQFWGYQGL